MLCAAWGFQLWRAINFLFERIYIIISFFYDFLQCVNSIIGFFD